MKYPTLFSRLVAQTVEPESESGCWMWSGSRRASYGYGRFNLRAGGTHVTLVAHLAAWVLCEIGTDVTNEELYLAYLEFRHSGLEIDHTCFEPGCINPDHMEPVTHSENCARKYRR